MVAAPPPPNFKGDLKISDQNNCGWGGWGGEGGGPEQKIKFFLEGAKFKGGPKILGGGGL